MSPVTVSIVVPTRDRRPFLQQAVASALAQQGVTLEVIVVDDASSDDTAQWLAALPDARAKTIRHTTPRGVAQARNRGAAEAQGEWLAFLDDDDLWAPTWLGAAVHAGETAEASLVYGGRLLLDRHREPLGVVLPEREDRLIGHLHYENAIGGPSVVVLRTEVFRDVGGFDPRLSALADWDVWLRASLSHRIVACARLDVGYTLHAGNMHIRAPLSVLREFRLLAALLAARGIEPPGETGFVRWLAGENRVYGDPRMAARLHLMAARRTGSPVDLGRSALCLFERGPLASRFPVFAAPDWLVPYRSAAEQCSLDDGQKAPERDRARLDAPEQQGWTA